MRKLTQLMLPLAFVGTLGLLAAGCPCKQAHVNHAGHKAKPCGCKGPCKGDCKRGYHGRKGGCKGKSKCGRRGAGRYKMMRKIKRMGAPKLLCPKMLKKHAKMLGLSADQVTKLEAIIKTAQAGKVDMKLKAKQAVVALKAEWLKDRPDGAKIKQLAGSLLSLVGGKLKTKLKVKLDAQKVLTAEQWMKIRAMRGKGRWHGKRGYHGKGGCKGCKDKKGPCAGCKARRHGRKHGGKYGKYGHGGCGKGCMMKKVMKMGAPKGLCPMKLMRCGKKLGITDDQKAKLKALFKGAFKNMGAGRITAKRAFLNLKLEWLADAPDAAKLGTHGLALWNQVRTKLLAKLAMKLAMQKLLTPEQWKKVRTCKGCCKGKRGGCKGCKGGCKGCKGKKRPCKGRKNAPCNAGHNHGA